ncbi:DNA primase catalytic subunit PriS [Candidatus Micrarchaeota archaeon]|nr:DNA primase catalytic subunit PriS [Candidatus Micrarchaeota archaeon]
MISIPSKEFEFVKKKFGGHYARVGIEPPQDFESREFGFGWEDKIDYRHKAFSNASELKNFFVTQTPLYASYSTAHYRFPAAKPMEKKQPLAWDLVFDLDAPTRPAQHVHDSVFCSFCFDLVKGDALRLVEEFLEKDFGFTKNDVSINFSGSKGLHVHVNSRTAKELTQDARKQLLDCVRGPSPDAVLREEKNSAALGPSEASRGWGGKIHSHCRKFLENATLEQLRGFGLRSDTAKRIIDLRKNALAKLDEGNWSAVAGLEKIWAKLVPQAISEHSVNVDRSVTFDAARLIRIPETLHGDSALAARKIPASKLSNFNPLRDAVAFTSRDTIKIKSEIPLEIEYAGETQSVKQGVNELREGLALLLLCKAKAVLA